MLTSVLCSWAAVSSLWSLDPIGSLAYAGLFTAFLAACALFWLESEIHWADNILILLLGYCISVGLLAVTLGLSNRSFGGVNANLVGHFGLAIFVLSIASRVRIKWILAGLGLFLIVFAEARTVLVSASLFALVYGFGRFVRSRRGLTFATMLLLPVSGLMLLLGPLIVDIIVSATTSITGVTEASRLENTGFSGRANHWRDGIALLDGHELFGYGFRTRSGLNISDHGLATSAHSGIINMLLDIGLIGAILFFMLYISAIWQSALEVVQGSRIGLASLAFLLAMIPTLMAEPNYANFAHPSSFILLLFMMRALTPGKPLVVPTKAALAASSRNILVARP